MSGFLLYLFKNVRAFCVFRGSNDFSWFIGVLLWIRYSSLTSAAIIAI
jgi:hypothetical protein